MTDIIILPVLVEEIVTEDEYCHYVCPRCYPVPTDPTLGLCGSLLICGPKYDCGKPPCPECVDRQLKLDLVCGHGMW